MVNTRRKAGMRAYKDGCKKSVRKGKFRKGVASYLGRQVSSSAPPVKAHNEAMKHPDAKSWDRGYSNAFVPVRRSGVSRTSKSGKRRSSKQMKAVKAGTRRVKKINALAKQLLNSGKARTWQSALKQAGKMIRSGKKAPASRRSSKKTTGGKKSKGRSAAQKAATKKMLAANKAKRSGKGKGGRRTKAGKAFHEAYGTRRARGKTVTARRSKGKAATIKKIAKKTGLTQKQVKAAIKAKKSSRKGKVRAGATNYANLPTGPEAWGGVNFRRSKKKRSGYPLKSQHTKSRHTARAKKAMNLFHSGKAKTLKAAWKMV